MLTWAVVGLLAIGVYGQRAIGATSVDTSMLDARRQRVLAALPLAIVAAVIVLQTVTTDRALAIDARLAGLCVAGLCAWRRLPLLVTVLAAAAATAAVRALT